MVNAYWTYWTAPVRGTPLPATLMRREDRNGGFAMTMRQSVNCCLPLLLCLAATGTISGAENQPFRKLTDIRYAQVAGHDLLLDLYLPGD